MDIRFHRNEKLRRVISNFNQVIENRIREIEELNKETNVSHDLLRIQDEIKLRERIITGLEEAIKRIDRR
jgi:hypothetical protein